MLVDIHASAGLGLRENGVGSISWARRNVSPWDRNDLVSTRYLHECHEVMMSPSLVASSPATFVLSHCPRSP